MAHPLEKARVWELCTSPGATPYVRIKCDVCGDTADRNVQVNTPPHVVANWFKKQGWKIKGEGKRAKCPDCATAKREPVHPRAAEHPLLDHGAPPPPAAPGGYMSPTEMRMSLDAASRAGAVRSILDRMADEDAEKRKEADEERARKTKEEIEAKQKRARERAEEKRKAQARRRIVQTHPLTKTRPSISDGRVLPPLPRHVRNADKLRDVIAWLYDKGFDTPKAMLEALHALEGEIPYIKRVRNLEERVRFWLNQNGKLTGSMADKLQAALDNAEDDDSGDGDLDGLFDEDVDEDLARGVQEDLADEANVVQQIMSDAIERAGLTRPDTQTDKNLREARAMAARTRKKKRRSFTDDFKLDILEQVDAALESGGGTQVQEVLDEHGLYSSHITNWRAAREHGRLTRSSAPPRGKPVEAAAKPDRKSVLANVKQQRAMFALLEDNFDEENGVYTDGWTDERIAEEVGVDVSIVTAQREAAFGKLQDSALMEAETKLLQLKSEFAKEVSDIRELMDAVVRSFTERVADLTAEIEALKQRH